LMMRKRRKRVSELMMRKRRKRVSELMMRNPLSELMRNPLSKDFIKMYHKIQFGGGERVLLAASFRIRCAVSWPN
jgi:hypothetical protein